MRGAGVPPAALVRRTAAPDARRLAAAGRAAGRHAGDRSLRSRQPERECSRLSATRSVAGCHARGTARPRRGRHARARRRAERSGSCRSRCPGGLARCGGDGAAAHSIGQHGDDSLGQTRSTRSRRGSTRLGCTATNLSRRTRRSGSAGPADLLYEATSADDLANAVRAARTLGVPYFVLGLGANILVGDRGVRGLVIRNIAVTSRSNDGRLWVESGAVVGRIIPEAVVRGWSGLEHYVGIPSTIGGAIWQNLHFLSPAPARERTMFIEEVFQSCELLTSRGRARSPIGRR